MLIFLITIIPYLSIGVMNRGVPRQCQHAAPLIRSFAALSVISHADAKTANPLLMVMF